MTREPIYSAAAAEVVSHLEDGQDRALLNAVADAIDLVCDHGDTAEARREQLRTSAGTAVWKVTIRGSAGWVLLWSPSGTEALIHHIRGL